MPLAVLAWAHTLPLLATVVWSVLINIVVFWAALGLGALIRRVAGSPSLVTPTLTRTELVLASVCVLGNSVVMFAGWQLFQTGALTIVAGVGIWRSLLDALTLIAVMDLAMFATHRLAHLPIAFRHIHGVHHRHVQVRPLSLFVLHPLEVFAFGGLWICVLLGKAFSLEGMLLYLTFNTTFGVVGHLGLEPLPTRWLELPLLRNLGSSSFHARHHQDPRVNFGFYSLIWDRLFRSLDAISPIQSAHSTVRDSQLEASGR
jgi:Delta7-sterol 5-desaturase